jgi:hypothetical protein
VSLVIFIVVPCKSLPPTMHSQNELRTDYRNTENLYCRFLTEMNCLHNLSSQVFHSLGKVQIDVTHRKTNDLTDYSGDKT